MGKLSKREESILYMKQHHSLLACPICKEEMKVSDDGHITCSNRHTFDIAKQGYINFMTKPNQSMYSKNLFTSRQQIINSGIYDRVQERIAEIIGVEAKAILDTGCGEGSHLVRICNHLPQKVVAVGIDISKEGIISAAKYYDEKIWCVGDLANSPYKEKTFDVILNFLSPANYEEFHRLLKDNGKVIKVVPQSNYLSELRKQAFSHSEKEKYSNDQTVERFKEQFSSVLQERITYTLHLPKELVPKLLEMTPLGWHVESLETIEMNQITIDLDILVGEL